MILKTTGLNPYDDHIAHYGILGMRWGRRKQRQREKTIEREHEREMRARSRSNYRIIRATEKELSNFKNAHGVKSNAKPGTKTIAKRYRDARQKKINFQKYNKKVFMLEPEDLLNSNVRKNLIKNAEDQDLMANVIYGYMQHYNLL